MFLRKGKMMTQQPLTSSKSLWRWNSGCVCGLHTQVKATGLSNDVTQVHWLHHSLKKSSPVLWKQICSFHHSERPSCSQANVGLRLMWQLQCQDHTENPQNDVIIPLRTSSIWQHFPLTCFNILAFSVPLFWKSN